MKRWLLTSLLILFIGFLFFSKKGKVIKNTASTYFLKPQLINKTGTTIKDRVLVPENYRRIKYQHGTFSDYIQNYTVKPYGSKVINYDGNEYFYQEGHVAVLDIPVPKNGLQQCADALIRLRAEYLWQQNRKDEIGFNFTSGHYCSWNKYALGYRPKIKGNQVSFHKISKEDFSKRNFYSYLNLIFMYAGTLSLNQEMTPILTLNELQVGDMVIYPGSPGHVIMIADKAIDEKGNPIFVLAQGNTPAQSVHVLKNPTQTTLSPWFILEIGEPLEIPTYYFNEVKCIRFK